MKLLFSTVTLFILLVLVTPNLRAQSYGPYYDPYWDAQYQQYLQWQQYLQYLQQNDPYYPQAGAVDAVWSTSPR